MYNINNIKAVKRYNVTFSTMPFIGKAANQQKYIMWREEAVTIEEFVSKIQAGYLYSNCTYKPFDRNHPEKGYFTQSNSAKGDNIPTSIHGMSRKYLSYWYMYSFSIITFDVDGSRYSPEKVYERLSQIPTWYRDIKKEAEPGMPIFITSEEMETAPIVHTFTDKYCPTLIYTTYSDRPGHRCYRILYFLNVPGYSEPILPFYEKQKNEYLWGDVRWKAGKNYLEVYNIIKEQILQAVPELEIDQQSHVAVQTYNGNSCDNFKVIGEYKEYFYNYEYSAEQLEKLGFVEERNEPIDNFLSESYKKNILTPRLERQKRIRSLKRKVDKTYREFTYKQQTGEKLPKAVSTTGKFDRAILYAQLFGDRPLEISLPSIATTNRTLEPDLWNYELNFQTTSIPDVPVLSLNDEEFEGCSEIGQFYKRLNFSKGVRLAYPQFLKEFITYNKSDLFYWYKDRYPNVWQSSSLNYKEAFDYPDEYKVIYSTLEWKFNPLISHEKAMKMNDGDNRKFHITALSIARKILAPKITFDHLLFNAMVDTMFLVCDYKKSTREKSKDLFTRETIARCVARAWHTDSSDELYKRIDYLISQHPKTHLKYDKVTAMTMGRREKAAITEQRISELYDHTLTDRENLEKFATNGLKVSLITLKRYRQKNGLAKRGSNNIIKPNL